MPRKREDLTGRRFGHLTVSRYTHSAAHGHAVWECRCDCGRTVQRLAKDIKRAKEPSCGCKHATNKAHKNTYHGLTGTTVYGCWARMLQRCLNPKDGAYHNYGGRGIGVCERWMDFADFYADMGHPPEGMSIERRDNDGSYHPDNCYWASKAEQVRNHRRNVWVEFDGRRQVVTDWANELGMPRETLRFRLAHWSVERALTEPVGGNHG